MHSVLTDRLKEATAEMVSEELEGSKKGKYFMDQIFSIKMMEDEKKKKLNAASMNLGKKTYFEYGSSLERFEILRC